MLTANKYQGIIIGRQVVVIRNIRWELYLVHKSRPLYYISIGRIIRT